MKRERDKLGRFVPRKLDLRPTWEIGYLLGLIIGDGSICKLKSRNYLISVGSTKTELIEVFCDCCRKLGLNPLGPYVTEKTRKFPNGVVRTDLMYSVQVNSKVLYDILKPCKQKDYRFKIPSLVLKSNKAIAGFLQGFFDAEASVTISGSYKVIAVASKHVQNLEQIKNLLNMMGIRCTIGVWENHAPLLRITDKMSILEFHRKIGFRIRRKKLALQKLVCLLENGCRYYTKEEYEEVLALKKKGLGSRRIARKTQIPRSTILRWLRGAVPHAVRIQNRTYTR